MRLLAVLIAPILACYCGGDANGCVVGTTSCTEGGVTTKCDRCCWANGGSGCSTCSDGEQNGDETGTDCGGSCPACPPLGLWLWGAIHLLSLWFSYLFVNLALMVIFLLPGGLPYVTRTLSAEGAAA